MSHAWYAGPTCKACYERSARAKNRPKKQKWNQTEEDEVDMTGDGELDEEELRQFLLSKKKEGRLRKDVDTKVGTIMEKYDMGNKGFLDLAEFEKMQAEVLSEAPVDIGAEVVNIKAQLKAMRLIRLMRLGNTARP